MTIEITVSAAGVSVELDGLDRLWALRRRVDLVRGDIARATVMSRRAAMASVGWRLGGTAAPGVALAGNFTFRPAQPGRRQFWAVYRDTEVLVIDTHIDRPHRVVVQHPDRVRLAGEINALVSPPGD